jgi:hypothetical protein
LLLSPHSIVFVLLFEFQCHLVLRELSHQPPEYGGRRQKF